jgi:hypothetical protein
VAQVEESRGRFDHYMRKMESLSEEESKLKSKGKSDKGVTERVQRNEAKMMEAATEYNEISDAACESLEQCLDSRAEVVDPIVVR